MSMDIPASSLSMVDIIISVHLSKYLLCIIILVQPVSNNATTLYDMFGFKFIIKRILIPNISLIGSLIIVTYHVFNYGIK